MTSWHRLTSFDGLPRQQTEETWIYSPADENEQRFPIQVTNGKPFNVLSLKGADLDAVRDYATFLESTAQKLYGTENRRPALLSCPCCRAPTDQHAVHSYTFIGVPFHRCDVCGHGFVLRQPAKEALGEIFRDSGEHSAVYVDPDAIEIRMDEIIAPKIDWTFSVYEKLFGARPKTSVDIGAGGGHFVEGLRRAGLNSCGYELSESSRAFAKCAFNIDLLSADFLEAEPSPVDLVTFWGLLEYATEPRRFLETSHKHLKRNSGMLVLEVPRLECLGTAIQAENPYTIARHMDPTSHVNTFSDAAIATALVQTGFRPVAVWYFGMDVYEFLTQVALRLGDSSVIDRMVDMIAPLQAVLDYGRQCDDIVIAAVPV